MTNSVTFDTSGWVAGKVGAQGPRHDGPNVWRWGDLSPFCQGFVEAAFASLPQNGEGLPHIFAPNDHGQLVGVAVDFSDLHPSTLARFMEDCEKAEPAEPRAYNAVAMKQMGARYWRSVAARVRLHLSPDGKVLAEEVG